MLFWNVAIESEVATKDGKVFHSLSLVLEGTLSSIVGTKLGIDDPWERYDPS